MLAALITIIVLNFNGGRCSLGKEKDKYGICGLLGNIGVRVWGSLRRNEDHR